MRRFWERSRCSRFIHDEISEGRVELMELLKNEMKVRLGRRQSREGKGPATLVLERSRE